MQGTYESEGEEKEEWRQTRDLWVSSLGRVMGRRSMEAFFPTASGSNGCYRTIEIDRKRVNVHLLVAEAFLGPPPSVHHTVDHINRKSLDNRLCNLRWATKSEQLHNRKLPMNTANSIRLEVNIGAGWVACGSYSEATRTFGVDRHTLRDLVNGKRSVLRSKRFTLKARLADTRQ